MAERFLLDTSAIFTYTDQEDGFEVVRDLLVRATGGLCELQVATITLTELYYVALRDQGEDGAVRLLGLVKAWPLSWVPADERTLLLAGHLKASHRLSLADSLIAATAILRGAILVHKDPELTSLRRELELLDLPFK